MARVTVHKIMIATAVLFCGLFSVRGFLVDDLTTGGVFAVLTIGLLGYLHWFKSKRAVAEE